MMRVTNNRIRTAVMQGTCIDPNYALNDPLQVQKQTVTNTLTQLSQKLQSLNVDLAFANKGCKTCSGVFRRNLSHWKTVHPQLQHIVITDKKYYEGEFFLNIITKISNNLIPVVTQQIVAQQNQLAGIEAQIITNNTLISNAEFQKSACEQQNLSDMQVIQAQLLLEEQLRQQGVTATGAQIVVETETMDNKNLLYIGGGALLLGGILYFNRKKIFKK